MTKLFGIPMTGIMGALLAIVFIALLGFLYAAVRNPVLFRMGLRNIPRRRAQSIVIVFGLMISTLIITAAFTVGDSLSYSITKAVYDTGGPVDLKIETQSASIDASSGRPYIADSVVSAIEQQTGDNANLKTWLPVIDEPVPAGNPRSRLNEPRVHLVGLDPRAIAAAGGLPAVSGANVQVDGLAPGEAYINKTAAAKLDAKAGDTIGVLFNNQQFPLTVKGVLKDRTLSGWQDVQRDDNGGIVLSLDGVRAITGHAGGITDLWLSTGTNIEAGNARGNALFPTVKQAVASPAVQSQLTGSGIGLKVHNAKHDGVESAQLFGNGITAFFVTIGLFSIAAGMMLIFLIFVMLAAERRPEMGMARAVGIKRAGLVQSFLAEGMVYNLLAGLVGVALGIAVAFGLVWFVTHVIFTGKYELPLSGHLTLQSLVVSYCLGVALTFITVVISAYKATRMNIVAAIRDLPEDSARSSERRRFSGKMLLSSVARLAGSIAVLVALSGGSTMGVVALPVALIGLALLVAACLPVTRSLPGILWRTVAGVFGGTVWGVLGASRAFGWSWMAIWSGFSIVIGALALVGSHSAKSLFLFTLGVSLILLGLALVARVRGLSGRVAFSGLSVAMIVFWLMPSNLYRQLFGDIYGHDRGGAEMFFLSGIMLVVATTLLLIENGEAFATLVNRIGGRLGSLRPALVTAIAYPMASKLRTGMTLAMFSLIIFSITVMSTINTNFTNMLLTKDATGGWDVTASTNLNNPVPDLKAALAQAGVDTSKLAAIGATTPYQGLSDVRNAGDSDWKHYNILAADAAFLDASTMKLQAHVKGDTASGVWKELQQQPGTAVIDAAATSANNNGSDAPNFQIKGASATTTLLDRPLTVDVRNAAGEVKQLRVIGIINQVVANTGLAIFTSADTYQQTLGARPLFTQYAIRLQPGTDDKAVAKQIKANLAPFGVQASAVRSDLADQQAQVRGFSYLFEGFMGLGLVVGIAAVAVIAARTVVERRQQIGMLRAVGYRRGQVALSFALETSFIALFGLVAGVVTASILSYNLFTGGTFGDTSGAAFQLPYLQIALFAGVAYVASLLMTYFPSRKAAGLPIAEALRYE